MTVLRIARGSMKLWTGNIWLFVLGETFNRQMLVVPSATHMPNPHQAAQVQALRTRSQGSCLRFVGA